MLDLTAQNLFDCGRTSPYQEAVVNRSELVEKVAEATGLEKSKAEDVVKAVIDIVIAETRSGEKVSIFGFGAFSPTARAARTGRNPQTGAPVKIKASKSVRFAPASAYKLSLNTRGGAKKTAAKSAAPAKKSAAPAKKTAAPAKTAAAKSVAPVKKAAAAGKKTAPAKAAPVTTKASVGKKASAAKAAPAPAPAKASKKAGTTAKATKSKSAKK